MNYKKNEAGAERIYNDRDVPLEDLKKIADDYAIYVIRIDKISSESNLTYTLNINGEIELSDIAISFNKMVAQMREMIGLVSKYAHKLSDSASTMTQVSNNANNSLNTQRDEIQQVSIAINQMVFTAQKISHNAESADAGVKKNHQ